MRPADVLLCYSAPATFSEIVHAEFLPAPGGATIIDTVNKLVGLRSN
jgi:hypothetical protein